MQNNLIKQASILVLLSIFCRACFLLLTTAIYGDAINYSLIASELSKGQFDQIDTFWVNLFCYWESIFYTLGFSQIPATILSTFIPGVFLILPVLWISRKFYGPEVGWLVGLFCALHPRLISYSTNGYSEMFYIFALTTGVAFLIKVIQEPKYLYAAFAWGAAFGVYACVRNEGILFFLLTLPLPLMKSRKFNPSPILALIGFIVVLSFYVLLCEQTIGEPGLFQKASVPFKKYSEQLDFEKSVQEVYSNKDIAQTPVTISEVITTLAKRYPRNILYSLEKMPGILLSPLFLFAFVLLVFPRKSGKTIGDQFPLLLMLIFPVLFYPLIQVEPRHFLMTLIPITIFGSAGLFAFYKFLETKIDPKTSKIIYLLIIASILIMNILTTLWLGHHLEKDNSIQKNLAEWVKKHVKSDEVIVGDGYGYISSTGFLSERQTIPRIWTNDPKEIIKFLQEKNAHWLILYEPFIEKGNPELIPYLGSSIDGLKKMYEIKDDKDKRYQIYYLD